MPHIAVFAYAAAGHVTPLLGIVAELTARGHRVTWATTEAFAGQVEAAGAAAVLHPESPSVFAGSAGAITAENARELSAAQFRTSVDAADAALARLAGDPPDLVVYDSTVLSVGRLVAHRAGCPAVQVFPTFAVNDRFNLIERMPETARMMAESGASQALGEQLAGFLERFGLPMSVGEFYGRQEPLSLAVLPKAFQWEHQRFGEEVAFVGPCLGARAEEGGWEPPDSGRPVVLVSLGTNRYEDGARLLRECIAEFAEQPWHTVAAIGRHLDPAELGPLPAHVEARSWVPQPAVLRHAAAFVGHAGMGGTMEALYFGVPQVGVPHMPEQIAVADRLVDTGTGLKVPLGEASGERLRESVAQVLADDRIRTAAADFREHTRAAGGAARAADEIEGVLAGKTG